jgi:hypothetical protein
MHAIRTEAFIPASPEAIWRVLTDFDRFHEWNPLNIKAKGKPSLGARIPMTFLNPAKAGATVSMTVKITRFEPNRVLEWLGHVPIVFKGRHIFELTPEGAGTRLLHGEDQSGLIAKGNSADVIRTKFVPAYEAMNEALARRLSAANQ